MTPQTIWEFINPYLQTVLLALLPILAAWIVTEVKLAWKRANLPQWIVTYSAVAVNAAAQVYKKEQGAEKKAYALQALQALLNAHGIKLDATALDVAIEDAVSTNKYEANYK